MTADAIKKYREKNNIADGVEINLNNQEVINDINNAISSQLSKTANNFTGIKKLMQKSSSYRGYLKLKNLKLKI